MSSILTVTDVVVRYNEKSILDRATLGIQEGERIGLVGRNGCGKTTFLKILAGELIPDSGDVSRRRDLVTLFRRCERDARRGGPWTRIACGGLGGEQA